MELALHGDVVEEATAAAKQPGVLGPTDGGADVRHLPAPAYTGLFFSDLSDPELLFVTDEAPRLLRGQRRGVVRGKLDPAGQRLVRVCSAG